MGLPPLRWVAEEDLIYDSATNTLHRPAAATRHGRLTTASPPLTYRVGELYLCDPLRWGDRRASGASTVGNASRKLTIGRAVRALRDRKCQA